MPKISPSGWNWAQVRATGALGSVTLETRRPDLGTIFTIKVKARREPSPKIREGPVLVSRRGEDIISSGVERETGDWAIVDAEH